MFRKALSVLTAVLVCGFAVAVHAQEADDSRGDYATVATNQAALPAGHFALIASYADQFLSANDGTGGHRTIFAQTLMDGVDDPAKADEIGDYYLLDVRRPAD